MTCKNILKCLQEVKHLLASTSKIAGSWLSLLLKETWKAKKNWACALFCFFKMFERHEELELGLWFGFFLPCDGYKLFLLVYTWIEISRSHTRRQPSKGKTVQESTETKSHKKEQTSFFFCSPLLFSSSLSFEWWVT